MFDSLAASLTLLVELFVGGLAVNALVEVWHTGSIFSQRRDRLDFLYTAAEEGTWTARWYELWLCPFCLSFWVTLVVAAFSGIGWYLGIPLHLVNWVLAVMRVANLVHDLSKSQPPAETPYVVQMAPPVVGNEPYTHHLPTDPSAKDTHEPRSDQSYEQSCATQDPQAQTGSS